MEKSHSGTPVKKRTRSCKQTKEQTDQKIQDIYHQLLTHIGKPAILFEKESREMVPYFVVLDSKVGSNLSNLGVVALQKCYHPDGGFRCYISHTVNVLKIMIGDQQIIFFDEGI